jgi:hypothetical protein
MNDIELRERFGQWAAPLRATPPPGIAVIRRRTRRRTVRLSATAATLVAAVAVTAGLVAGGLGGSSLPTRPAFWGSAKYPAPPGQPFVLVNSSASGPAELRNVATGTVETIVPPEGKGALFTALAAAPGDRLFVLAWQDQYGELGFDAIKIGTRRVHFGPMRLPTLSLHGALVYGMTVNPAGTRLVFNTIPPGGAGPATMRAYNLVTGALIGSWQATGGVNLAYWPTADRLAIDWPASAAGRLGVLRILETDRTFSAGSSLAADTRPDPAVRGYDRGALTTDGSIALAVTQSGTAEVVQEFSAASGRLLRTVPIGSARALQQEPEFCGVLWASANGRSLLTQCGTVQQAVSNGKVTPIRLPWRFLAQQDGAIDTFAW